ncbi:dehydrogenase [Paenibacillus marchantiophytorum]|uniref:Dehydrogenase n=1 Tax=Paenibacillus marchantiophytorum TaxID=1619310 RepID=A0ABQ1F7V4_9BACL|nr:YciI family protein [Paenibacillus marchantiophytorum]GGA02377.1 dehydrogenase [Paenibacillus marchantiophytorum]
MRFMLIVKATGYSEAGLQPSGEHREAATDFKKSLVQAGAFLDEDELLPSSTSVRIVYPAHDCEPNLESGPFPLQQDLMAAYTLIDVASEEEALNWALRMPVPPGRGPYKIELRKLQEHTDSLRKPNLHALEAALKDQLDMLRKC